MRQSIIVKAIFIGAGTLSLLTHAKPAFGDDTVPIVNLDELINSVGGNVSKWRTLGDIISPLLRYLYAFAGIALLLFLIGGGYGFLTSGGDPKKMEAAKNTITLAIIGFLIIIAAYWATQIANYIFGLGSPIK